MVNSFPDIPGESIAAPATTEKAVAWLGQHWSTLGLIGLSLFGLLMLRSMIRSVPAAPGAAATAGRPTEAEPEESEPAVATTAKRLARFTGSGRSLRDELSELVQEDPDAAANILRTWIGTTT